MEHDFGILADVSDQDEYYDYTPQKYNCLSVEDEIICELNSDLSKMKSYFHSLNQPVYGLALHGNHPNPA